MSKITLQQITNLQNENTAVSQMNANSTTMQTAFDNTLSRDGTAPNQMGATLDMNSNRIINLPAPVSLVEPLRLQDVNSIGSVTVHTVPVGGLTGQGLVKKSNTDYDMIWSTILGGSNTQVQYNNNGVFAGILGATTDGTNLFVTTQTSNDNSGKASSTSYADSTARLRWSVNDIRNFAQSPQTYDTVGISGDDTTTLQAAINTVKATGGTIFIPEGRTLTISSTINLKNSIGVRITGSGAGRAYNNSVTPAIMFTGASGSLFQCDGSNSLEIDHLRIQYNNAAFTGNLIDLNVSNSGSILTGHVNIHDNYISGISTGINAASLIVLTNVLGCSIERNFLVGAVQLIKGGAQTSTIRIADNWFDQSSACTSHIGIQGQGWLISNNTFEPTSGVGAPSVTNNIIANGLGKGVNILANVFNDGGTGTAINLVGAVMQGLTIKGNEIQGGTAAINVGSAFGVSVLNNDTNTNSNNNIIVGSATDVTVLGNTFNATPNISLVPTMPTAGVNVIDDGTGSGLFINKTQGFLRLTADVSVTSSTAFVNVNDLTMNVVSGAAYFIEGYFSLTDAAAGGIKLALAASATASQLIADSYIVDSNTIKGQTNLSGFGTFASSTTTATSGILARIYGSFICNGSGAVIIQFAQNTSNATASVLKKGSWLKVTPVA